MVCEVGKCLVDSLLDSECFIFFCSPIPMDTSSGCTFDGRVHVMADLRHGAGT